MKIKNRIRNYLIRVNGHKYETKSIVRFLRHVRTIKWSKSKIKVYLRVSYGKQKNISNSFVTFYNDGTYTNEKDFNLALNAFLE